MLEPTAFLVFKPTERRQELMWALRNAPPVREAYDVCGHPEYGDGAVIARLDRGGVPDVLNRTHHFPDRHVYAAAEYLRRPRVAEYSGFFITETSRPLRTAALFGLKEQKDVHGIYQAAFTDDGSLLVMASAKSPGGLVLTKHRIGSLHGVKDVCGMIPLLEEGSFFVR